MKIVTAYPPNIDAIRAVFDVHDEISFAYGDTLYNPSGNPVSADLMAHEQVHQRQQGDDPEAWWEKYLRDPAFRLAQEIEAYQVQYRTKKKLTKDRNELVIFLNRIAGDFSGPMYGNLITRSEAINLIRS